MKILSISDSFPVHPRLKKVSNYFGEEDLTSYLLWNRESSEIEGTAKEIIFNCPSEFGNKWKKAKNILSFRSAIKNHLSSSSYDKVICRHWQQLFIIATCKLNPKTTIIYDVCDMPNNKWIRKVENFFIKKVDVIVLASRFFTPYYQGTNKEQIILENRPWKNSESQVSLIGADNNKNSKTNVTITFLGKIRYGNILKKAIDCVNTYKRIEFHFYGTGPDEQVLKDYVKEKNIKQVFFHGKYTEHDISRIYEKSDVIWAAYDNRMFNVQKAVSNKFFETLAYQTPGIFSENTDLGNLVNMSQIGFTIDPFNENSINECLKKIQEKTICRELSRNIKVWPEAIHFDTYIDDSLYRIKNEKSVDK